LLFGGLPLKNHQIPAVYGAFEPTAIKVPLKHFRGKKKRELLTTEVFGPFQIIVEYGSSDIEYL
jgi:1-pyrroline-5-carboxylate dehydrogenase